MAKLVVLKLGDGDFELRGFPVTLLLGEEGTSPSTEITGRLPPAPKIPEHYSQWTSSYRHLRQRKFRLEIAVAQITNESDIQDCRDAVEALKDSFNLWLNSEGFRPLKERLFQKLNVSDTIRIIIQTGDFQLRRLPWHLWDLCEIYRHAEAALSAPEYDNISKIKSTIDKVRILAILGNKSGINVEKDRDFLESLPWVEPVFLDEPKREEINQQLWEQSWDILFFAGHSRTEGETGRIYVNQTESLTIRDLKHGLRKAIEHGLQLAIFNSCDGLGLAEELEDLHIPQVIVMREPVPDRVAQEFLKYFMSAFARGKSLYLAVREARERLCDDGWEAKIPGATWLPVICQNPAVTPLSLTSQSPTFERILAQPQILVGNKVGIYLLQKALYITSSKLVYQAWNSQIGQSTCVKIFPPFRASVTHSLIKIMIHSVRAISALNHSHIARVFDFENFEFSNLHQTLFSVPSDHLAV